MLAGFHTAGLLLHDPVAAIEELAHLVYGCVAIRPHASTLCPDHPLFAAQSLRIQEALQRTSMRLVLDLDAMFVSDPFQVRSSSLMATEELVSADARDSIHQWTKIARRWSADSIVTFSSGTADPLVTEQDNLEHLAGQLNRLFETINSDTGDKGPDVQLAIRPRHGDFIDSVAEYERVLEWLDQQSRAALRLAADVGEMLSAGEIPIVDRLQRNLDRLACVYLCDRRYGPASPPQSRSEQPASEPAKPRDLRIGRGEVAVDRIVQSLNRAGFHGPGIVRVEGCPEAGLLPAQEAISIFE